MIAQNSPGGHCAPCALYGQRISGRCRVAWLPPARPRGRHVLPCVGSPETDVATRISTARPLMTARSFGGRKTSRLTDPYGPARIAACNSSRINRPPESCCQADRPEPWVTAVDLSASGLGQRPLRLRIVGYPLRAGLGAFSTFGFGPESSPKKIDCQRNARYPRRIRGERCVRLAVGTGPAVQFHPGMSEEATAVNAPTRPRSILKGPLVTITEAFCRCAGRERTA